MTSGARNRCATARERGILPCMLRKGDRRPAPSGPHDDTAVLLDDVRRTLRSLVELGPAIAAIGPSVAATWQRACEEAERRLALDHLVVCVFGDAEVGGFVNAAI